MGLAERTRDNMWDLDNRVTYHKVWMRPPGINADIQSTAEATREIVDTEFELLGANAVSTVATISTTGGCQCTTVNGATDGAIILPHLDASQSAWATTLWDTAKSPRLETRLLTGSSIATCVFAFGYKLTNTSVIATDDDQAYFRYAAADAGGQWQFITSRAGTDVSYTVPTSIVAAVAASTAYKLSIEVYSDRTVMGFINDVPVRSAPFAALTSLTTLIPYPLIILNASANAKTVTSRYVTCSKLY